MKRLNFLFLGLFLLFSCQKDDFWEKKKQILGVWRFTEYQKVEYFDGEISKTEKYAIGDKNIKVEFLNDHTYLARDEDDQVLWRFLKQYEGTWRLMDAGNTLYFDVGVHEWPDDRQYGESSVYFRLKEVSDSHMIWEREIYNQYADYTRRKVTTITLTR